MAKETKKLKSPKVVHVGENPSIVFVVNLTGDAARIILEMQNDKRVKGIEPPGKARATQILLCELYNLKQKSK